MVRQRHRKIKKARSARESGRRGAQKKSVMSMEEFRAKYLPTDEKRRAARHLTPEEVGAELARASLTAAKQALTRGKGSSAVQSVSSPA